MDIGGTLLIEAFGQLRVFPETTLLFERNGGRFVTIELLQRNMCTCDVVSDRRFLYNLRQPVLSIRG